MKFTIASVLLCIGITTFSQTSQKKILFKLDPTINAFNPTGTNTPYAKTSRGPESAGLTPRIELCDTKDGFTIRTDFHIKKYDDNFNLVWDTELKKNYSLQARASSTTIGDEKNSFFIETTYSSDASVNRIDEKGKLNNIEIAKYKGFPFMMNHEAFFLGCSVEKKTEKLNYQLTRIDPISNSTNTINISVPWDEYEYALEKSGDFGRNCLWRFLKEKGDHVLLKKIYFKDLEKTKLKELVFETLEIDAQGKIYDLKKWKFSPEFANDKRKFVTPTVAFDDVNNELMLFGYMSIDERNLNGLFVIKYDYNSQNLLYSKEYNFNDILKSSDSRKTHSNIPKSVGAVVPLEFSKKDYYLNKKDRVFTLQIITNYHGSTTTYYELKFDKYGDLVQTDLVEYETFNFNYQNGLKSVPSFHEQITKDKSRPHFTNARPLADDYLNNNPNTSKEEIYAFPIDRLNYSIVVFYNEDSGEFSALKLK